MTKKLRTFLHMAALVTAPAITASTSALADTSPVTATVKVVRGNANASLMIELNTSPATDSFVAIEHFGRAREAWLKTVLHLPNGIPSHDTIGRIFALLDPKALEEAFRRWTAAIATLTKGEVVAIDGKTLRRSFQTADRTAFVHMVSAWAAGNRMVLGQIKTDDKSNEITAIPRLLELLRIEGCLVTIDAMGCQKEIASKIVDRGADYMLGGKDNQPTLSATIS